MNLKIKDIFGKEVQLEPKVELYTVQDFMGEMKPGLCIDLIHADGEDAGEPYATLTVCFGEFIGMKNCAYVDTNNCYFAGQLLEQGIAKETGLTKDSGFCTYPLWQFEESFLTEISGSNYEIYAKAFEPELDLEGIEESEQQGMNLS